MAKSVLEEFVISFGLDTKKMNLASAEAKIKKFADIAIKTFAAIELVKFGARIVNESTIAADAMIKFASTVNTSVEKLSVWEQAAIRAGGSADSLRGSLSNINKILSQEALMQGDHIFMRLGIAVRNANGSLKDPIDTLKQLNRRFQNLDQARTIEFAKKLGIDDATLRLIKQTPEQLDNTLNQMRKLGVVSTNFAKRSAELRDNLADLNQVNQAISREIASALLPIVNKITVAFVKMSQWILENIEVIKRVLLALAIIISAVLLPVIVQLGIAILAALLPILPMLLLITAVIGSLIFIIEDLIVGFRGGESVIFETVDNMKKKISSTILQIKKVFIDLGNGIKKVFKSITTTFTNSIKSVKSQLQPYIDAVTNLAVKIKNVFTGAFSNLKKIFESIVSTLENAIMPLIEKMTGFFDGIKNNSIVQKVFGNKDKNNSSNNITTSNKIDNVTVNVGSGDPDQIKGGVTDGIFNALNPLTQHFSTARQ